jgi:predicted nucleic acid-binding protein
LVVDASITLAWLIADENTPEALRVRDRVRRESAIVPSVWRLEVANGLVMANRRGRLNDQDVVKAIEFVAAMPIQVRHETWHQIESPILLMVYTHRLTVYDAAYLWLAMRSGLPLGTLDKKLRAAADAQGVPLA